MMAARRTLTKCQLLELQDSRFVHQKRSWHLDTSFPDTSLWASSPKEDVLSFYLPLGLYD